MARGARALQGLFGEMLERLLRSPRVRGAGLGRSGRSTLPAAHRDMATKAARRHMLDLEARKVKRRAAASAAVDSRSGRVYTGRIAEGVSTPPAVAERLPHPSLERNWAADHCAEVSAASKAVNDGCLVDDLVIVTVDRRGEVMPPCNNCRTWVPKGAST